MLDNCWKDLDFGMIQDVYQHSFFLEWAVVFGCSDFLFIGIECLLLKNFLFQLASITLATTFVIFNCLQGCTQFTFGHTGVLLGGCSAC